MVVMRELLLSPIIDSKTNSNGRWGPGVQAWLCTPVIPAMWEVKIAGQQYKAGLGQNSRPYLKNN
jgi:hypothetical protein